VTIDPLLPSRILPSDYLGQQAWRRPIPTEARFYAATFPDSGVTAICQAPGDYPSGKEGDILTMEFTVCGIPCMGINGGPQFSHTEAFSFQIATDTQE